MYSHRKMDNCWRNSTPNNRSLLAFLSDGQNLLAWTEGRPVQWNSKSGKEVPLPVWSAAAESNDGQRLWNVRAATLSPDQGLFALDFGESIGLWERDTGQEVVRWRAHESQVRTMTYLDNGRTLLSSSLEPSCLVWDIARLLRQGRKKRPLL